MKTKPNLINTFQPDLQQKKPQFSEAFRVYVFTDYWC